MSTVLTYVASILLILSLEVDHAVYISVVEITDGQVEVKVFTDDLQSAVRNYNPSYRAVADDQFCAQNRASIQRYFQSKLKVSINDQPMDLSYRSATKEGDSYWITFDMASVATWKSIAVEDRHFMELFPTQTNIIKIMGGKQRFCKLTVNKPDCRFPM